MNTQLLIAIAGLVAAFGGVATGIVALRKVGVDNRVAIRSVASTESDATMAQMHQFNEALRQDNITVRAENSDLRNDNDRLRAEADKVAS